MATMLITKMPLTIHRLRSGALQRSYVTKRLEQYHRRENFRFRTVASLARYRTKPWIQKIAPKVMRNKTPLTCEQTRELSIQVIDPLTLPTRLNLDSGHRSTCTSTDIVH